MSIKGVEFLHSWMKEFITDSERGGDSLRALVLATQCRDAAAVVGVTVDDEPEHGTLESIIYARMQMSKRDELIFWRVYAAMRKKFSRLH